jgi:TetR/AcrR family transcriptional regulator
MPQQDTQENKVNKLSRKEQILQSLVSELEKNQNDRVTTASLAKAVGVSEAALYRHFPSKSKMFEGLIEFCEQSIFSLIQQILTNEQTLFSRCEHIVSTILLFSQRNPGICKVLTGHALIGEDQSLNERVDNFFQRIETHLRQIFREAELNKEINYTASSMMYADMLLAIIEGQMNEYVRTGFKSDPVKYWSAQWALIQQALVKN